MPLFVKTELIKKEFINEKKFKDKFINKHIKWVQKLREAGFNITSGFLVDEMKRAGAGGLLIIEAENYKVALKIIENDPMIKNKIVEWNLSEWIDISS